MYDTEKLLELQNQIRCKAIDVLERSGELTDELRIKIETCSAQELSQILKG
jgi:hypothetical protein